MILKRWIIIFLSFSCFNILAQPGDYDNVLSNYTNTQTNQIRFLSNNIPTSHFNIAEIKMALHEDLILQFNSSNNLQVIWEIYNRNGHDSTRKYDYSDESQIKLVLHISRYPDKMVSIPFTLPIDSTFQKPFVIKIPFHTRQENKTYLEMVSEFKDLLKKTKEEQISINFYLNILPKNSCNNHGIPLGTGSLIVRKGDDHKRKELTIPSLNLGDFFDKFKKKDHKKEKEIQPKDTIYPVENMEIYKKMKQQLPHYKLKLYPREDVRYQYLNTPHLDPAILDSIHRDDKLYYGAGYQIIKKTRAGKKFTKGYVYVAISAVPEYEGCLFYFDAKSGRFLYAIGLIAIPG